MARDKFEDEKASALAEKEKIENEIKAFKNETEKDLSCREKIISEKEAEFSLLQEQVNGFPEKLKAGISKAVKETTERLQIAHEYEKNLLEKQFEGERNVLKSRIESLEKTVQE